MICAGDVENGGIDTCRVRSIESFLATMSQSPHLCFMVSGKQATQVFFLALSILQEQNKHITKI